MALSDAQAVCLAESRPDVVRHFTSHGWSASTPSQIKAIFNAWWGYNRGPSAALPAGDESHKFQTLDEYAAQKCGGGSGSGGQSSAGGGGAIIPAPGNNQGGSGLTGVAIGGGTAALQAFINQLLHDPVAIAVAVALGYVVLKKR